jgi:hypothetical protein
MVSMIKSWFETTITIFAYVDPWKHHFSGLRWAKPLFLLPQKVLRVSHCDIVRLWPQHHLTVGQAARQAKKLGICLARRESCAPVSSGLLPVSPNRENRRVELGISSHSSQCSSQGWLPKGKSRGKKTNCPPNLCPIVARLEQPWCHWLEIVQKTEFVEKSITSLTKFSPVLRKSQMCLFQWGCAPNYGSVW